MSVSNMIYRKLLSGFLSAITFTFVVTIVFIIGFDAYESLGGGIIGISLVIAFYATPVILLYGIPVSIIIESIFRKKSISSNVFYIIIHMLFGMASYFMFWEWGGVIYGVGAASIFAMVDRVLSRYKMTDKLIIATIVIPIGLYAFLSILIAAIG